MLRLVNFDTVAFSLLVPPPLFQSCTRRYLLFLCLRYAIRMAAETIVCPFRFSLYHFQRKCKHVDALYPMSLFGCRSVGT